MLTVRITNKSLIMLGSGTGAGSYIDNDIILDENGLPLFPGRRFKGLLRESAMEVLGMFDICKYGDVFSEDIVQVAFGTSTVPAGIRINDLRLYYKDGLDGNKQDAFDLNLQAIADWLKYLKQDEKHKNFVRRDTIVNALTEIRQQTAICEDGYAKAGSLRTIRVLKTGFVFWGKIRITKEDQRQEIEDLLILSLMNLRKSGTNRNRGLGEIECAAYKGTDFAKDLVKDMHGRLKSAAPAIPTFRQREQVSGGKTQDIIVTESSEKVKEGPVEMVYLPYEITSLSPLLFTSQGGDENMVNTSDYIPGSALRGYFANQLIREEGLEASTAHEDMEFRNWFLNKNFCFSNAYPLVISGEDKDVFPLSPAPMFLHQDKDGLEFSSMLDEGENSNTKYIGGYCTIDGRKIHKHTPRKIINFHLVRANGGVDDGGIFHYEAIESGQKFYGYIAGTEEELEVFKNRLGGKKHIYLGRSLNTQYGKAKIRFNKVVTDLHDLYEILLDFSGGGNKELGRGQVLMYLLSPLLLTNEMGFYSTSENDLIKHLQEQLGVENVGILKSFARVENSQAFVSHLKIYDPSFRGWAAGSSFLLELGNGEKEKIKIGENLHERFNALMVQGIGEKRGLGYGRVIISTKKPIIENSKSDFVISADKPTVDKPQLVRCILNDIYADNLERVTISAAIDRAKDYYDNGVWLLSNSLMGRLENICRSSVNEAAFGKEINRLRDDAKNSLKGTRIKRERGSLFKDLTDSDFGGWCINASDSTWEFLKLHTAEPSVDYKLYWQIFFNTIRKKKKAKELLGREQNA